MYARPVTRLAVASLLVVASACSVVVDDTLDGKPTEQTIAGGVGGQGIGAAGGAGGAGAQGGALPTGGAGGATTGQGGSGGAPVICAIGDDFDDGVVDPMWDLFTTTASDVVIAETGGVLQITIPSGPGNRWGRARTSRVFTDGCGVTVRYLDTAGAPSGDELAYVELRESDDLRAGFHLHGPTLKFWTRNGASETTVSSTPYQPSVHVWWRLRGDGADLVWETSDGASWVEREREAAHLNVSAAEITLGAGVYGTASTDGLTVRYDDLNVNAPP